MATRAFRDENGRLIEATHHVAGGPKVVGSVGEPVGEVVSFDRRHDGAHASVRLEPGRFATLDEQELLTIAAWSLDGKQGTPPHGVAIPREDEGVR